jgi:DNA gyrase subunit B
MRQLIDAGHLYIAQPPLFKLMVGRQERYAYTDKDCEEMVSKDKARIVNRFKGLGEMNAEQLWDTTMDPDQRQLLQVALEDEFRAEEVFATLMGNDVEARRHFIQHNASDVRFLDF